MGIEKHDRDRWINLIWDNYDEKREQAVKWGNRVHPSWWACFRASVALIMGWEDESLLGLDAPDGEEVAWMDLGPYHTDFGTGYSFAFLKVVGWRYAIGQDGTL